LQKYNQRNTYDKTRPNEFSSGKKEITLKINSTPNREDKFHSSTQNIELNICDNQPVRTPSPMQKHNNSYQEYNKDLIQKIVHNAIDNSQEYLDKYLKNKDFSGNKHLTT